MRTFCVFLLGVSVISGGCLSQKSVQTETTEKSPAVNKKHFEYMNLFKPAKLNWDKLLPSPEIPPPPKEAGLSAPEKLTDSEPLNIEGNEQLAKVPNIKGKGTQESPYIIENLNFTVKNQNGITITKTSKSLIIRNCRFNGMPASKYMPVEFSAIQINESKNIVISLNEVTRCHGITIKKSENITVSKCQVFSTIHGIFSDRGRNIKANYNWVEDSVKYGIFLYNGPDHEIGHNYVAWTGREGIGTNGNQCQNHYYHDNTIIHAGWTAINVEENFVKPGKLGTAKTRVENNLIVDTYYGIILMGNGVICDSNKIYYSSQDGIIIVNNPNAKNHKVKNNLVVGSAQNGIWISQKSSGHLISGNQIIQSHTAVNLEGENCKLVENRISRFMNGINSNVKQVEIVSNEIFQGRNGMSISRAQGGTKITGNHFHHVLVAMWMSDSEKVELTDNIFNNCPRLPQIRKSNNILFKKNKALYTSRGIGLRNTSDCIISENTFYSALCWFVWVEDGKNNKIEKNQIKDVLCQFNGGSAIRLKNAENNFVGSNIITNSKIGFQLEGKKCNGNTIEKNTLDNVSTPLLVEPKKDKEEMLKKNHILL